MLSLVPGRIALSGVFLIIVLSDFYLERNPRDAYHRPDRQHSLR